MDPALGILDSALKGEEGALSFLERTATIYVYDGTNPHEPKTCGAWDFINEALNAIERFESRMLCGANLPGVKLENHIQLLAKMSRRASRRTPKVDEQLVTICLQNAHSYGTSEQAHHLIDLNHKMRQRVMGRIAAFVFDFSNYSSAPNHKEQYCSAFKNPVVMENLCAIVAANTISSGTSEFSNLVSQWIIPSLSELPSLAVATITYYLASESSAKSVPSGTNALKNELYGPVVTSIISPILLEYAKKVHVHENERLHHERIIAISVRALARWSKEAKRTMTQLKGTCSLANIDIIQLIGDVMESESILVLEALEELLSDLLSESEDIPSLQGMRIVGQYVSSMTGPESKSIQCLESEAESGLKEYEMIVSKMSGIMKSQQSRFNMAITNGQDEICLCLVSMVRSVATSLQHLPVSSGLTESANVLAEFLIIATSHPSIHVCGIALDAIVTLLGLQPELSTKLLPILQGRAIIPPCLVDLPSKVSCNVDFQEFERFREFSLSEALIACYQNNQVYYIKSCSSAVDEFCSSPSSPQLPYQLEAALFCMTAVSAVATRNANTSKQERDINMTGVQQEDVGGSDLQNGLEKCSRSLTLNPSVVSSTPYSIIQASNFFAKYATWLSKSSSSGILDAAISLVFSFLSSMTTDTSCSDELTGEQLSSHTSDVAKCLLNIVRSSPERVANAKYLSSIENVWKNMYSSQQSIEIGTDVKTAIAIIVCQIISVFPPGEWSSLLSNLTAPSFEVIWNLIEGPEDSIDADMSVRLSKLSEEIHLIATIINAFHDAVERRKVVSEERDSSILIILQKCWVFSHQTVDKGLCVHENVSMALSETLSIASTTVDISTGDTLKNICDTTCRMMDICVRSFKVDPIIPILGFVKCTIDAHGSKMDAFENTGGENSKPDIQCTWKRLLCSIFESSYSIRSQEKSDNEPTKPLHAPVQSADEKSSLNTSLLSICSSCIRKCPHIFINLKSSSETDKESSIFGPSIELAMHSIKNVTDVDSSLAAMKYLTELLQYQTLKSSSVISVIDQSIPHHSRTELVTSLLCSACGRCPREILDSAAKLLYAVLRYTTADEAGPAAISGVQQDFFLLGDQGRQATILVLGKCSQGIASESVLIDLFHDIWRLHQIDDTGNDHVGGDSVESFCQKYGS